MRSNDPTPEEREEARDLVASIDWWQHDAIEKIARALAIRRRPPIAGIEAALRAVPKRCFVNPPHDDSRDCGWRCLDSDIPAMARAVLALMEGKG